MPKTIDSPAIEAQIGVRIKSLRFAAGLSQAELAAALGITFQQVQKYENGKNRISLSRAMALAKTLDSNVAELTGTNGPVEATNRFDKEAYKGSAALRQLDELSPIIARRMRMLIEGIRDDLMTERRKKKR
jgi:transcriptional regulator with XRE-family HTH domain